MHRKDRRYSQCPEGTLAFDPAFLTYLIFGPEGPGLVGWQSRRLLSIDFSGKGKCYAQILVIGARYSEFQ